MADTRHRTTGRRMAEAEVESPAANLPAMPSTERIQQELATAKNLDDFFGKEGIFMMAQFVKTPNRAVIRAGYSFPDCKTLDKAERT